MKRDYTKETLEKICKECYSLTDIMKNYGLSPKGNNFQTISKYVKKYSIDISHFTGSNWNKGLHKSEKTALIPLSEILKDNVNYKIDTLKERLFNTGLKDRRCEICGNSEIWQNNPIKMELHHINGDHYDNRIENLQILCPNCHSQTNNFRNRGQKKSDKIPPTLSIKTEDKVCPVCNKTYHPNRNTQKYCSRECYYSIQSEK